MENRINNLDRNALTDGASQLELDRNREIDLIDVLIILAKSKVMILIWTLAAVLMTAISVVFLPNMYTATTTILPPQQSQSALTAMLGQLTSIAKLNDSDLDFSNPADLFIGMFNSHTVEDRLVDRFDLRKVYGVKHYQDARKELERRSYIVAEREGLISINVTDRDPVRAANLANAYVDEFHKLNSDLGISEASQRRVFYEQRLASEREDLSLAEMALKQAQERTGLLQPDAQTRAIIDSVADMRAQVALNEVQLQGMRTYATQENPEVVREREKLASLRSELAKLERDTGDVGNGNLEVPTQKLPQAELEYFRRARDMKYHETLYELLNKQLEAARIDEAKDAVVVQVVDRAVEPEKKSAPARVLIVLIVAVAAFLLSCVGVLVSEILRRKKEDPYERARLSLLNEALRWPPLR